jgi:hypothetical protein
MHVLQSSASLHEKEKNNWQQKRLTLEKINASMEMKVQVFPYHQIVIFVCIHVLLGCPKGG